jgi:hypothetical protein
MHEAGTRIEEADRSFAWTDDGLDLAARADLATAILRREDRVSDGMAVQMTGEEALLWVVSGGEPEALRDELAVRRERIERHAVGILPGVEKPKHESRAERARRRYHEDAEYRERVKADARRRRDCDEFRARERDRKRKARAAAKAAQS